MKNKIFYKSKLIFTLLITGIFPTLTFAADTNLLQDIADEIINPIILLMFAAAAVYFLWGVLGYIKNGADPSKREQGAKHILWGLVGIAIMFGVYGILNIVINTFV